MRIVIPYGDKAALEEALRFLQENPQTAVQWVKMDGVLMNKNTAGIS
ncbi:MAG: hypothetical protein KatS3mg045_1495 [Bellilinea sp.]|nr:MAG: hypothetical protein KatS3mg045_1495 [Bellilinea sp.]